MDFNQTVKLKNGDTLPAGTYRMEVPENSKTPTVTFSQDGQVKATIQAKVLTEQKKNEETACEIGNRKDANLLTAVRPQGWDEEILFAPEGQ